MGLYKNIASQKVGVFAWDTAADAPKTGDAANITAQITKDFGTPAATDDVNPTELDPTDHPGVYYFNLTQAETNADNLIISAVSSTADINLDPLQVFTDDLHKYGIKAIGTAQSASATGLVIAASEAFADDVLIGNVLAVYGSTQGYWQERIITDNALSGDSVTVPTWTVTPSGTITYVIFGSASGMSATDIATAITAAATANPLAANVKEVNDVALVGDGDATPWGPA